MTTKVKPWGSFYYLAIWHDHTRAMEAWEWGKQAECKFSGKTNGGVGCGMGGGWPSKGQAIVVVPPPKCKSLEVRHQEVMVWERVNELTEVRLEVDHDMVCAMGHANVGILSVAG